MAQPNKNPAWESLDEATKEAILDAADSLSHEKHGQDFKTTREELAAKMSTTEKDVMNADPSVSVNMARARSVEIRAAATTTAEQLVKDLLLKVLYQEIHSGGAAKYLDFIDKFPVFKLEAGNAKEYVDELYQGVSTYTSGTRVENTEYVNKQLSQVAQFYKKNGDDLALNTYSFQWKIWNTIKRHEWVPFFTQGNLEEYIAQKLNNMRKTKFIALADYILSRITAEANLAVNKAATALAQQEGKFALVEGTAPTIYQALTNEILPIFAELKLESSKYNYGGEAYSGVFPEWNKDKYIVLVPDKFYTAMMSMLSQLPSAQLMPITEMINLSNIRPCGNRFEVDGITHAVNQNTGTNMTIQQGLVSVTDKTIKKHATNKYIPDNQIIIINTDAIQRTVLVDQNEQQSFAANMSTDVFIHNWENIMFRKSKPFIVYKNDRLLNQQGN